MSLHRISTPLTKDAIEKLKIGDEVLLSGTIFTARDMAHKRLIEMMAKGRKLPIDLSSSVIYYAGPTPASPGWAIGSCGPTTSSRMDPFTSALFKRGLVATIGKGTRSHEVRETIKKRGCIYFLAVGGAGAFLATKVVSAKAVAFKDLGPEAIYRLEVKDFPLIVGIDAKGNDIYDSTRWKKA